MAEQNTLKVGDIVKNFKPQDVENATLLLNKLKQLNDEYASLEDMVSPERLEEMKREVGSYLTSLSTYLAKVKCYRFNNDYLEEERKQIKSEAIELLVANQSLSPSAAEKIVYASEYYKSRVELLQRLKRFFWDVELKYDRYRDLLRNLYQSVSVVSEERRRNN